MSKQTSKQSNNQSAKPSAVIPDPDQKQPANGKTFLTGLQILYAVLLLLLLIGLTILAFSAVSWFQSADATSGTTQTQPLTNTGIPPKALEREDRLVVGVNSSFEQLNPLFATGDGEQDVVSLIFEPLFTVESDGSYSPVLAESWLYDTSERRLSVTLRGDHTFRDGRIVSAQDVIYTYQCLLSPAYNGPLKGRLSNLLSIEAGSDNRTIHFRYAKPLLEPDWSYLTIGILKADYYQFPSNQVFELRNNPLPPEGSGCFRLTEWENNHVVLALRSGYAGEIRTIEIRQIASEAKMRLIQDGQVDIIRNVWDERMKQRAQSLSGYSVHPFETSPDRYLLVSPVFRAQNVIQTVDQRLALLLAIDGQSLNPAQRTALNTLGESTLSLFFFKGLDAHTLIENRNQAQVIADQLRSFNVNVLPVPLDWPELAERATQNRYDLLLLPATANSRLPEGVVLLKEPVNQDASAIITHYQSEALITCDRLRQLSINPYRYPFAATSGSWTDRIANVRLLDPHQNP